MRLPKFLDWFRSNKEEAEPEPGCEAFVHMYEKSNSVQTVNVDEVESILASIETMMYLSKADIEDNLKSSIKSGESVVIEDGFFRGMMAVAMELHEVESRTFDAIFNDVSEKYGAKARGLESKEIIDFYLDTFVETA